MNVLVVLPTYDEAANIDRVLRRIRAALDEAITFAMALTLPAAAAMLAIPFFMIDGLFTRGLFHTADARQTAAVLLQYGWGAPAFVLMQIVNRAFYAARTPGRRCAWPWCRWRRTSGWVCCCSA